MTDAASLAFFFNDTATTEIYTLSLHDALPIYRTPRDDRAGTEPLRCIRLGAHCPASSHVGAQRRCPTRSEEHTSELQAQSNIVCALLLEQESRCPLRTERTGGWGTCAARSTTT